MAIGHINFSDVTSYGSDLKALLAQLEHVVTRLRDHRDVMDQMKDNGVIGTYLQGKYGYATVADAQAGYAELDSLLGKLTTDNSVTNVNAALTQAAHKFA